MATCVRAIEPGEGRVVLVVTAHADDATLFIGGTVAAWADAGWHVVVLRATDDRWDSVGLDEQATTDSNRREFREAATVLGVAEIAEFGLATDVLGDTSVVALREQIIRAVRTFRPYALVTFDPYSMFGEDNLDHIVLARATDEAFWTSQFDLHHREHMAEGLEPHGCFERWYFGRRVVDVTDVVDVSTTLDRKIAAAVRHRTMMRNFLHQLQLQARTGGWRVPMIDEALGDHSADSTRLESVVSLLVRSGAERTGAVHGLSAAEEFRIVTFGGMLEMLERFGERR